MHLQYAEDLVSRVQPFTTGSMHYKRIKAIKNVYKPVSLKAKTILEKEKSIMKKKNKGKVSLNNERTIELTPQEVMKLAAGNTFTPKFPISNELAWFEALLDRQQPNLSYAEKRNTVYKFLSDIEGLKISTELIVVPDYVLKYMEEVIEHKKNKAEANAIINEAAHVHYMTKKQLITLKRVLKIKKPGERNE